MKKLLALCLTLAMMCTLAACSSSNVSTATQNENTTQSVSNEGVETVDTAQNIEIAIAPSEITTAITVTGSMVEYFVQTASSGVEMSFVLQLETEESGFAELRVMIDADGTQNAWSLMYEDGQSEAINVVCSAESLLFTYSTDFVDLDEVAYIFAYITENGSPTELQEHLPMDTINRIDAAAQPIADDTYGIAGVYIDSYDYAVLTVGTDAFGYTANLNGVDYALTIDEYDGSTEYIAYVATSAEGERFCLNLFEGEESATLCVSEYYGEAEMRYTFTYHPIFNAEFYSYDRELNKVESPIEYVFESGMVNITIYDTYTTGWIELGALNENGSLEAVQMSGYPITSLVDGEVYFMDLMAFAKVDYWYPEMHMQIVNIYQSYYSTVFDCYVQNALLCSDTVIAEVETDSASQESIRQFIGTWSCSALNFDGEPWVSSFEITEDALILEGEVIAAINIEKLYATISAGGCIVLYDGDTPEYTLSLTKRGDLIDLRMETYGTYTTASIDSPPNIAVPVLSVTISK